MNEGIDPPARRPDTGDTTPRGPLTPEDPGTDEVSPSSERVSPGDIDLPWKATAERRSLWGPIQKPLEGTVHAPGSAAVGRPRSGRSGLFSIGVPLLTGGLVAAACLVVGLGTAIVGPLAALGIAAGAGVIAAGGSGAAVRALRAPTTLQVTASAGESGTTAQMLAEIRAATARGRERTAELRRRASEPTVGLVLENVDSLARRIDALADSDTLRGQRPYESEVTLLEGIATRYVPELLDSVEEIVGFLATFAGSARREALANLEDIDQQLAVLAEGVERVESDIVAGVSHSLDVHAEFLRARFADQHLSPIIDV
ncbi:hypothetical protein [Brachybacterium alimentarium]|uniref:hypothetical protein n=1 Tax=Brachybacterium alimentarium TaxID=47845 RepID=UPI0015F043DE|nr:hypothetical protein [Brachybacterium alimentarium]